MDLIVMIVVGFVIGLIARAIMPGQQSMGLIMTTILGIVGALVGGFLGRGLGWYQPGQAAGWILSVIGAVIVLALYGMLTRKR